MLFIEMTQDPLHGGDEIWGFSKCLWSPTEKKGGGQWGYWEVINKIRSGDTIVHLQKCKSKEARIIGLSTAESEAYVTTKRPPNAGRWSFAESFYRLPLKQFRQFEHDISIQEIFERKAKMLQEYYETNRRRKGQDKRKLFFVYQGGRLQCQNGAYLSEVDSELADIIFDLEYVESEKNLTENLTTGEVLSYIKSRIGQQEFSRAVRANYHNRCCFPGCSVDHDVFLIGAHIDRWADNPELRGDVRNGLCLCLFHDRAFEMGFFTLTKEYTVLCNRKKCRSNNWLAKELLPYDGQKIDCGNAMPLADALEAHWKRVQFV